jgi:hypothetical protein
MRVGNQESQSQDPTFFGISFLVRMFRNVKYMASSTVGINENRTGKCITCEIEYRERNTLKDDCGLCCNTTQFHKQCRRYDIT